MTTTLLDLVNTGDIVHVPALSISYGTVVCFGSNPDVGQWLVVTDSHMNQSKLILSNQLVNAKVSHYNSIPRNSRYISWMTYSDGESIRRFATAYGHLGNKVWEFEGKRIMENELLEYIDFNDSGLTPMTTV